jgi:glycosyltransferase involved in cell wall biosynthesis
MSEILTMRNPDLASVIIPCYNQARFLGEAIESVFAQTYPLCEIIVVDDGSTDDTAKIAASFQRVRCLRRRNGGIAGARNAGFGASNGSYVVFLDADDRLLSNALQDGVNSLKANHECAFSYGHVKLIARDGSPLPIPHQIAVDDDHYLELLRRNYIWTAGAVVYRREVLESVGAFNVFLSGSADFDLNARITRLFPVCCSGTSVLEYRRHDESMSRDYALMLKSAVKARRDHRRFVKGRKQHESALLDGIGSVQKDYGEKLILVVSNRLRERNWSEAFTGLITLLQYYPWGFVKYARGRLNSVVLNLQN